MAAPDFSYESLCIQYPDEDVPFVLKTGLIHLLPKFHGLAGECPHKHLKDFHYVSMRPQNVLEDQVFLRTFPYSLEDAAREWMYCLTPRAITSWDDMKRLFLAKFFPASRTTAIRKDITGIRQLGGESLYEYWERFKKLCDSCPHHQIPEQLLLQYFYEGLNSLDRSMIDAASGGALGATTPTEARQLIEKMASNSQQFGTRSDTIVVKGVHDIVTQSSSSDDRKLETKIDSLMSLVSQMASNQRPASPSTSVARHCGLCLSSEHYTDDCPTLQQPTSHDASPAYAANIQINRQPQQPNYDLSSNRYNIGWRNHQNLRWNNNAQQQQQPPHFQNVAGHNKPYVPLHVQRYQRQQQQEIPAQPTPPPSSELTLEDLFKQIQQMNAQNMQFQHESRASIQNLTTQMGQMATQFNQAQSQNSDKLPSQTVQNPRNVSAITLRSGKQIDQTGPSRTFEVGGPSSSPGGSSSPPGGPSSSTTTAAAPYPLIDRPIPLPFPSRELPSKKVEEVDREILETFRKVEVNIPLLDAIKQIPKYAKFLKELCTHKSKMKGNERISMERNVSALIGKSVPHIPEKCKDPGMFCIPCVIGNNKFENAMLDLGASINVMPLSIYKSLSLGPLQPTGVVIQLANRSVTHPTGYIEDVLVRVGELIFPVDFYVLEMEDGFSHGSAPIILGRPFLKTARTKIDVYAGTLSMEIADIVVHFNILDAMKYPAEDHSVFRVYTLDDIVVIDDMHVYDDSDDIDDVEPTLELKQLPKNLKYVYLEDDERKSVIISTSLDSVQEERLLGVLRAHKKAIGLSLADIPGISPSTCMHRILLEDGAKPRGSSFFLLRSTLEEENSPCNRSFDGGSRSGSRDRFVEVSGASPWFSHWFSGSWFFFLSWFSVAGGSRWFCVSPSLHRDNSSNVSLFGKYGDNRATLASIWICIVVIMVDDEMREAFLSHCFAV
ncbi:uncharacterized protein LOC106758260 [Vigna radiata var. radiata]|uniref:Uncharacterized protein LOC106758260 n=1 Tax=Vigna radiata var. radiata TaxID=3916 RepID=A0A3Q0F0E3_VIGRR|nr:uncharacterized protein LOC106758260 [Vigna radiata var. radiata]